MFIKSEDEKFRREYVKYKREYVIYEGFDGLSEKGKWRMENWRTDFNNYSKTRFIKIIGTVVFVIGIE